MSNLSVYSKFGTIIGNETLNGLSVQGPAGVGFRLTEDGNYDIQNKNLENINNVDVQGVIENTSTNVVNMGSTLDLNDNNLVYTSVASNDTITTVLAVDTLDGNIVKETNLNNAQFTSLNSNTVNVNNQVFIKNSTQTAGTDQIHISNTVNASIWLEADTDNSGESDFAYLTMTEDGNATMHEISGGNNTLNITSGSTTGVQGINFRNATVVDSAQGTKPTFSGITTGLSVTSTAVDIFRPLDMNNQSISNINNIELESITANTLNISMNSNVNLQANNLLNVNEIDVSTLADITGGSGNIALISDINALDKSINGINALSGWATDPITVNSDFDINGNDLLQVATIGGPAGGTGNIAFISDIIMSARDITCNDLTLTGIFKNQGAPNLEFNDPCNFLGNNLLNIGLNSSFNASPTLDNTTTKILTVNGSNVIRYRDITNFLTGNYSTTFNNITMNGNLDATQGNINNCLQINNTSADITISPQTSLIFPSNKRMFIEDGAITFYGPLGGPPTTPPAGGFLGSLYKFGANLVFDLGLGKYILNKTHNAYEYAESLAFSSTTSSTNVTKLSKTTGTLPIGTYEITFQCQSGTNSSMTTSSLVDFYESATPFNGESCTSGLSGLTFAYSQMTATYKIYYSTATTHTYSIQYRSVDGVVTSHIRDARIFVKQIDQVSI